MIGAFFENFICNYELFHYSSHDLGFASNRSQKWMPSSIKKNSDLNEHKSKQIASNSAWECMKMHVLPWVTGRKDGNMGEPGPNATKQIGDAANAVSRGVHTGAVGAIGAPQLTSDMLASASGRRSVPSSRLLSLYQVARGKPRGASFHLRLGGFRPTNILNQAQCHAVDHCSGKRPAQRTT